MGALLDLNRQFLVDLYFDDEAETFTAVMPELPGCVAEGGSAEETRSLIVEAASLYLESLAEIAAELPKGFPAPFKGLIPRHSLAIGLTEILINMELDADHFIGSHVAMSNLDSGKVVVFPVAHEHLSSTTLTLLVHYSGIDADRFLDALKEAGLDREDDDSDGDGERPGQWLAEADTGPVDPEDPEDNIQMEP